MPECLRRSNGVGAHESVCEPHLYMLVGADRHDREGCTARFAGAVIQQPLGHSPPRMSVWSRASLVEQLRNFQVPHYRRPVGCACSGGAVELECGARR